MILKIIQGKEKDMSKSITIPEIGADPLVVRIDGKEPEEFQAGETYTVSDDVAAIIENIIASFPQESGKNAPLVPSPSVSDAGKAVVVGEDGNFTFGEAGTSENQYDLTFVDSDDRGYTPRLAEGDFSKMPTLFYNDEETAYFTPLFYKSMSSFSVPANVLVYYDSDGQTDSLPEGTYDMMSSAMYDGEKTIGFSIITSGSLVGTILYIASE